LVRWAVGFNGLSPLCHENWDKKKSKSINGNDKAREKLIERQTQKEENKPKVGWLSSLASP